MKISSIFGFAALLVVSGALAEERPVPLKDAPGRATVENMCSGCHSLDYIRANSPFMSRQAWTAEVNKMINAFGAPIPQNDAATIIEYLATNYGEK
jgi:sulfite dehydrogenase (cytochrome) subunit B